MTFTYDGFDRELEVIDALGNRSVKTYDPASNVVRVETFGHPAGQPAGGNVLLADVSFEHDELNRVFRTNESLFVATGFVPVRAPQLLDGNGQNDGVVTTLTEYDALSRNTFVVEDDGQVHETVYDGASRVVETIDALGNRVLTEYDRNSNPIRIEEIEVATGGIVPPEHFVTHLVYDQLDRVVRSTDNAGQTARFAYDSRDNLVSRSDPEGALASDPLGLFAGQINASGNTKTYEYDGLDRLLAEVCDLRTGGTGAGALDLSNPHNPDGQVRMGYEYDGNSRLVARIDDLGHRTEFEYDELDRRTDQVHADGTRITWQYDRDDNAFSVTDPNGTVVTRAFDALNRLTSVSVNQAAGVVGTTSQTYAYDGLSRLAASTDDNGGAGPQSFECVYDSLSRLLEERQNGRIISSVFAGDGKRFECTYPGGRTITCAFDAIDRCVSTGDSSAKIWTSSWIGPGYRELERTNSNGTSLSFLDDTGTSDIGYDAVKRIARLRCFDTGQTAFVDREMTYNRANVRTSERRQDDFGQVDQYEYDSLYRLTQGRVRPKGHGRCHAPQSDRSVVRVRRRRQQTDGGHGDDECRFVDGEVRGQRDERVHAGSQRDSNTFSERQPARRRNSELRVRLPEPTGVGGEHRQGPADRRVPLRHAEPANREAGWTSRCAKRTHGLLVRRLARLRRNRPARGSTAVAPDVRLQPGLRRRASANPAHGKPPARRRRSLAAPERTG